MRCGGGVAALKRSVLRSLKRMPFANSRDVFSFRI
jgi:hypothetical protein